jgi:small subunit ribosomal protein S17
MEKIRKEGRNPGYGIQVPPKPSEYDRNDPFYGEVRLKKNTFVGTVVSAKGAKTAIIVIDRIIHISKYHRYLKRQTRLAVHNPVSIDAKEGDVVRVFETRPLSKTKHHVIVEVVGQTVEIQGQDLAKEEKAAPTKTEVAK